jgi:ferritin-like metal-binding protein YciE
MMSQAEKKIVQYLNEAHSSEQALTRVLQTQIAMAPGGRHRNGLEAHLEQTRGHARKLRTRLQDLEGPSGPLQFGIGVLQSAIGQALALSQAPLELVRGGGGEEKVLKNAKDACASEALEIATYTAIERLARSVGDTETAALAASILEDEQKMLDRLLGEIPKLTDAVVESEIHDKPSYALADTGAADAVRAAGETLKETARDVQAGAKRNARRARKVPGVARLEGQLKGAVAAEDDLPLSDYDELNAAEIVERLPGLSQIDLAKIDSYERRHEDRTTVLSRITSLRSEEPWPGYDELTVSEIRAALAGANGAEDELAKRVRAYERSHKDRIGVLSATEGEAVAQLGG